MKLIKQKYSQEQPVATTFLAVQAFCFATIIYCLVINNLQGVLLAAVEMLFLLWLPWLFERLFNVVFPASIKITMLIFCISGPILGAVYHLYQIIPCWDMLLHTLNGFMFAAIGFILIQELNEHRGHSSTFAISLICAFCFSMTIAILWEFFEFGMDVVFHTDMQNDYIVNHIDSYYFGDALGITGSINGIENVVVDGIELSLGGYLDIGLYDTMVDMLVNLVGAAIYCAVMVFKHKAVRHESGGTN